jgi:hypothetical protein
LSVVLIPGEESRTIHKEGAVHGATNTQFSTVDFLEHPLLTSVEVVQQEID